MFRAAGRSAPEKPRGIESLYHGGSELRAGNHERRSVERQILRYDPLTVFVFGGDGEQLLIGAGFAGFIAAASSVLQNNQRRVVLPIRQLPRQQRMLRFLLAHKASVFLVVVMLPLGEDVVAVAVSNLSQELGCGPLGGAVAQRIHLYAHR